jgi:hypothetical protein
MALILHRCDAHFGSIRLLDRQTYPLESSFVTARGARSSRDTAPAVPRGLTRHYTIVPRSLIHHKLAMNAGWSGRRSFSLGLKGYAARRGNSDADIIGCLTLSHSAL